MGKITKGGTMISIEDKDGEEKIGCNPVGCLWILTGIAIIIHLPAVLMFVIKLLGK